MNDFIITILTSSAVSTIFLMISNIFIEQRKHSVEYITNERAKWRNDIRKIASEIMEADKTNIYKPLTELKVRINAYDRYIIGKRVKKDYFIWQCIESCEKFSENIELLDIYKKNLVSCLSLMLKYDWERSKREIFIDRNKILKLVLYIIQITIFAVVLLRSSKGIYQAVALFSGYFLFNLTCYILSEVLERIDHNRILLVWGKSAVHILTTGLVTVLTFFCFKKIDIEIGGKILLPQNRKMAFSGMALLPTNIILILNLMMIIKLAFYELEYFKAILEQNDNMNKEIEKITKRRKKNKK